MLKHQNFKACDNTSTPIKYIPFDSNTYLFAWSDDKSISAAHPSSDYYFTLDNLSINVLIQLRWVYWGFAFLTSISQGLVDLSKEGYDFESLIPNAIHKMPEICESRHIMYIDSFEITDMDALQERLKTFYSIDIFTESTKVQMTLAVNLREYLWLSNGLVPTYATINI